MKLTAGRIILGVIFAVLTTNTIFSENIVENQVEDPIILGITQNLPANIVTILDLSLSMIDAPVLGQIGNWDGTDTAICGSSSGSQTNRINRNFCKDNLSGLNQCGKIHCTSFASNTPNVCSTPEQLEAQEKCILDNLPDINSINDDLPIDFSNNEPDSISQIYQTACGGPTRESCGNTNERNRAAYGMEVAAGFSQCSTNPQCASGGTFGTNDGDQDPSCNTSPDTTEFLNCLDQDQEIQEQFLEQNCRGEECSGEPRYGSSRIDASLNVIFNLMDADNSYNDINEHVCSLNGNPVSCGEFINAPYQDQSNLVRNTDETLAPITNNDAEVLIHRFLPMSYSGRDNGDACEYDDDDNEYTVDENAFRSGLNDDDNDIGEDGLGFVGGSEEALERVWNFYRTQRAFGATPLALILGYDDSTSGTQGNLLTSDTLEAFKNDLETDNAASCRPQFVIVITDGDDTCSGDCSFDSGNACGGRNPTNANRRSTIQAVSNLRTHFARFPVSNNDEIVNKEVLTFVIGLGINEPRLIRALNAMALAGGTHTRGIIRHTDPSTGLKVGSLDIRELIPGTSSDEFEVFRDLAVAEGIDTNPANAVLRQCGNGVNVPDINGVCEFQNTDIFGNEYFDNGIQVVEENGETSELLDDFAFLVNSPEELEQAIQDIFNLAGIKAHQESPLQHHLQALISLLGTGFFFHSQPQFRGAICGREDWPFMVL